MCSRRVFVWALLMLLPSLALAGKNAPGNMQVGPVPAAVSVSGTLRAGEGPLLEPFVRLSTVDRDLARLSRHGRIDADGAFLLEAPGPGLYDLAIGAKGRQSWNLLLLVEERDSAITLEATLAPRPTRLADTDVLLAVGQKAPLEDAGIGTAAMPDLRASLPDVPGSVVFDTAHPDLTRMAEIEITAHLAKDRVGLAMEENRRAGRQVTNPYDYGGMPARLLALSRDTTQSLAVRRFAAFSLLDLSYAPLAPRPSTPAPFPPDADLAIARELAALLPPDDPLWVRSFMALEHLARAVPRDATSDVAEALLRPFVVRSPSRDVQATALSQLYLRARYGNDAERATRLYDELRAYEGVRRADNTLRTHALEKNIAAGKPVPDFTLDLMEGGTVSRSSLSGRVYLIDFWATWCGACVEEMPNLHRLYEQNRHRKGFTIVSISMDRDTALIASFRERRHPLPWMNVHLGPDFQHPLLKTFEVAGLPTPVLVDENGRIVAAGHTLMGTKLEKTLEAALSAGTGTPREPARSAPEDAPQPKRH